MKIIYIRYGFLQRKCRSYAISKEDFFFTVLELLPEKKSSLTDFFSKDCIPDARPFPVPLPLCVPTPSVAISEV